MLKGLKLHRVSKKKFNKLYNSKIMLFFTRDFLLFSFLSATFVRIVFFFFQLSAAYVAGPVSLHANPPLVVLAGLKFHKQLHSPSEETQFRNTES
jgi:hypothetical protein